MPLLLPPRKQIATIHELVTLIEAKMELNRQIATNAVELADAYHATWTAHRASWTTCEFGSVTHALTGKAAPTSLPADGVPSTTWVASADVLNASLPYIEQTDRVDPAEPHTVCEPKTILIAPRPDGARTTITLLPAAPGRAVLAVHPAESADLWWLLHELRFRGEELSKAAQGRHAREITKRAFSRLKVAWPGPDVRQQFHRVAEPLHNRAQKTLDENRNLRALLSALLRDISLGQFAAQ